MHNNDTNLQNRKIVESSTDSGICRSTEMAILPSTNKHLDVSYDSKSTVINVNSNPYSSKAAQDELSKVWNKIGLAKKSDAPEVTTIRIPFEKDSNRSKTDIIPELKRHSIAVDESKYVSRNYDNSMANRRTSLAMPENTKFASIYLSHENGDFDDISQRKTKKVSNFFLF